MKLFKRIVIAVVIVVFAAIILFVSAFIYEDQFKKTEVYREKSPDSAYEFVLYQVGSPSWPFGPVKAEIKVMDSIGKTVDKESILIYNDGAPVFEYNVEEIRWYDTKLELDCIGEISATYILELE